MHGPREPRRTARASPLAGWKTAWSRAANMRCVSGPKLWLVAMALAGGSLPCAGEPREADLSAGPPTAVARSALAILEAAAAPAGVARSRASPSGAAKAAGVASLWRDHKQMAWWILNITVVLIATIAISRRMS